MTIQEHMYDEFRRAGMTLEGACATLAQIQKESRFKSTNVEDSTGLNDELYTKDVDTGVRTRNAFVTDGIGYGYAQWTFHSRKALMYDFHKARSMSIGDSETQISFLIWEMKHYFATQWNNVCTSHNLYACVRDLLYNWENPKEKTKNLVDRQGYADEFLAQFKDRDYTKSEPIEEEKPQTAVQQPAEDPIQKVLKIAQEEVGYHEKASNSNLDDPNANAGSGNWTKYARDLDNIPDFYNGKKNGYAWCDIFVDWLFMKAFGATVGLQMLCQPWKSCGAGCLYSMQYYQSAGQFFRDPQPGDQIFFSYAPNEVSHTGIVESVSGGVVNTIEGNTSDMVGRRSYAVGSSTIVGYGRPKWGLAGGGGSVDPDDSSKVPSSQLLIRMIRNGMEGPDVKLAQAALQCWGYSIIVTGIFGTEMDMKVKDYQQKKHLEVDGIIGPMTWTSLLQVPNRLN